MTDRPSRDGYYPIKGFPYRAYFDGEFWRLHPDSQFIFVSTLNWRGFTEEQK
jgi:hypothetical protein